MLQELKRRLVKRGTEKPDVIEKRVTRAVEECNYMPEYDYIMVNDDLEQCIAQMHKLIQSLHYTRNNQQLLIDRISSDFKAFMQL